MRRNESSLVGVYMWVRLYAGNPISHQACVAALELILKTIWKRLSSELRAAISIRRERSSKKPNNVCASEGLDCVNFRLDVLPSPTFFQRMQPLRLALQMTEAVQICHAINASQSREVHQDNLQEPAGVARVLRRNPSAKSV